MPLRTCDRYRFVSWKSEAKTKMRGSVCRESRVSLYRRVCVFGGGNVFVQKNLFFEERYIPVLCTRSERPVFARFLSRECYHSSLKTLKNRILQTKIIKNAPKILLYVKIFVFFALKSRLLNKNRGVRRWKSRKNCYKSLLKIKKTVLLEEQLAPARLKCLAKILTIKRLKK